MFSFCSVQNTVLPNVGGIEAGFPCSKFVELINQISTGYDANTIGGRFMGVIVDHDVGVDVGEI